MRVLLVVAFAVHGLLHLLGVTRGTSLATNAGGVSMSSGVTPWLRGWWVLACVMLILSAFLIFVRQRLEWPVATVALLLSQALIFSAWGEAKAGTLVNLLLLATVVPQWAESRFAAHTLESAQQLLVKAQQSSQTVVTEAELAQLPEPIQRWLTSAGVVDKPRVFSVRLRQRGGLRTAPSQSFMPAKAEQYFSVDPPGFIWQVQLPMARVIPVSGRDSYLEGRGHMLIEMLALIPVVNARGPEIDQGVLLRYLAEMVWYPSAALQPYITWTPLTEGSARATMSYRGVQASADFFIDAQGRFTSLQAKRYMSDGDSTSLQDWKVEANAWQRFEGVELPALGSVSWQLREGEFTYYRWEITQLDYNVTETFPARRR